MDKKKNGLVWSLLTDQETLKEKYGITGLRIFDGHYLIYPPKQQGKKSTVTDMNDKDSPQ